MEAVDRVWTRMHLLCLCVWALWGCGETRPFSAGSIAELDRRAVMHFAIFSDNKGESPASSVEFARMATWVRAGGADFVIGLGDHLKYGWENSFIPWIQADPWWRDHTYLNVADGENEYYSPTHQQSAYGAGAPVLDLVRLDAHAQIMRANACEYYARIPLSAGTVHLLQLHFADQPRVDSLAFRDSSRAWLMHTLDSIHKGPRDVIVVAAHSRVGSWDMVLSAERRQRLLDKADLVLSATTHQYRCWVPKGFETSAAVCVNTGAVNFPGSMARNGYVEIHVLGSGDIIGQYMDLTQPRRRLQRGRFAWRKPRNGPMRYIDLRSPDATDNRDARVLAMADSLGKSELSRCLARLLRRRMHADLAFVGVRTGLGKGPVTREDAWRVFDKNKNLRVLRLPAARLDTVLARYASPGLTHHGDPVRVAAPQSMVTAIIGFTGLTHAALEAQRSDAHGLRQVDLLMDWLRTR